MTQFIRRDCYDLLQAQDQAFQENRLPKIAESVIKQIEIAELGKLGVIWGPNPHVPTFSNELSNEQIKNRLLLWIAATSAELVNYPYEYWHFSTGDRYATDWLRSIPFKAIYGGI